MGTTPTIEVLVGMIASGKTTYARRRADEGALIISHDDLTRMLHGRYRYEAVLRDCYRRMEQSLAWAGLNAGRDVIIDRTHLTRESRKRWIDWARGYVELNTFEGKSPTVLVVAVAFPIEAPCFHANRRMSDPRGRSYEDWLKVACHHHDQAEAEPLSGDEGFAEIRRIGGPAS